MKNKNLSLCTKWGLLGRIASREIDLLRSPSAWENHTIPESSSEAPTAQATAMCVVGGHLGGLASPRSKEGAALLLPIPFPAPASQVSLTVGWGDFKCCWVNLFSLCVAGLCNVFQGRRAWLLCARTLGILLHSGRLSSRVGGSCAVPFARRATENVPTWISSLA